MRTSIICIGRRCAPSCRTICALAELLRRSLFRSHVSDLVSDLGFSEIIELDWWNSFAARQT